MRSRRHLAMSRSAHTSAFVALCALALAVPAGAASAAPDDPDGEAAVTQQLQEVQSLPSQWWWDESGPDTRRARALLRQMTLDEKVDMLHGELNNFYGFYNGPIERLGIPALTMADGPAGVRIANPDVNDQEATQLPAPIALAATWDTALAEQYGQVAGDEAFRTGHNVLLSPAVDIARVAQAGPRVRGARRGPAAVRDDGCRRDPRHPVAPRRRGHQALQRVHAGDQPPQRRERRRRRAGAAGDLHAPVRDRRRAGPTGLRDVRVQQGQRCVRVRERRAAQPHPQGAARLRGLGDERLRRHAQHRRRRSSAAWTRRCRATPPRRPVRAPASSADRCSTPSAPARCRSPGSTTRSCGSCGPCSRSGSSTTRPVVSALPEAEHGAFARQVAERSAVLLKNDSRGPSPAGRTSGRSPSSAPTPTRRRRRAAARWSSRPTR